MGGLLEKYRDLFEKSFLRMVRELQSEEEFDQLINGDKLVLVDFFATWCPPCRMFQPILQNIEKEFAQDMIVVKVDVDQLGDLTAKQNIEAMPTFMFFKNGKKLGQVRGAKENEVRQ